MGSSEENPEQRNERELLSEEIKRLIEKTPKTPETMAILSVLSALMGAILTHDERALSGITTKFANEARANIERRNGQQN